MTPTIGKAYRGRDGIVRWVIGRSRRGYYHLRWLNEEEGIWFNGGSIKADHWEQHGLGDLGEAAAPQSGDHYRMAGVMGTVYEALEV